MTLRRIYELLTRRREPLDLEAMQAVDVLTAVLKSRRAAEGIVRTMRDHPRLWDESPGTVAEVLATHDEVGPAAAAAFVMLEVYAGRRHELDAAPGAEGAWCGDRRERDDGPPDGRERRRSVEPDAG